MLLNLTCAGPLVVEPLGVNDAPPVVDGHLHRRGAIGGIYHAVHPTKGRQDAELDFDGDLRGRQLGELRPLPPCRRPFYAFLETETHWFLTYGGSLVHPRDWEHVRRGCT